jgi:hypothetical protein
MNKLGTDFFVPNALAYLDGDESTAENVLWRRRRRRIKYSDENGQEAIEIQKGLISPGANVIKLFTAVTYNFS